MFLFGFWDSLDTLPPFATACIASWHRHMPEATVRIYTSEDLQAKLIEHDIKLDMSVMSVQKQSDVMRLLMLYEHGGIYMDATTLLRGPLDWVDPHQVTVFSMPLEGSPVANFVPENWFIAAQARNKDIGAWLKHTVAIMLQGTRGSIYTNTPKGDLVTPLYLLPVVAWIHAVQIGEIDSSAFVRHDAFAVLPMAKDVPRQLLQGVGAGQEHRLSKAPLIKFRGGETMFAELNLGKWLRQEFAEHAGPAYEPSDYTSAYVLPILLMTLLLVVVAVMLAAVKRQWRRMVLAFAMGAAAVAFSGFPLKGALRKATRGTKHQPPLRLIDPAT